MSSRAGTREFAAERARQLATWSDRKLCSWLLTGLGSGDFEPITILAEPSAAIQIHQVFCAAALPTQATIKAGLCRAIIEWSPAAHQPAVLAELARIAAHVRASEAVAPLSKHVLSAAFKRRRSAEMREACDILVAVLTGFVPLGELYPALLNLYVDAHFAEYGAQLFLALCSYSPNRFHEYAGRFSEIVAQREASLRMDLIMDEFVRIVPAPLLERGLPRLLESRSTCEFVRIIQRHKPEIFTQHASYDAGRTPMWEGPMELPASPFEELLPGRSMPLRGADQRLYFNICHEEVTRLGAPTIIAQCTESLDERFERT